MYEGNYSRYKPTLSTRIKHYFQRMSKNISNFFKRDKQKANKSKNPNKIQIDFWKILSSIMLIGIFIVLLFNIGTDYYHYNYEGGDSSEENIIDDYDPLDKILQWNTTEQFGHGLEIITNVTVDNDEIKLEEYDDIQYNENFSDSNDFIYNSDDVEFIGGKARIKTITSENHSWNFNEPLNYTYDSDKIEFDSGDVYLSDWNNNSIEFDGTNEYLDVGNDASLRLNDDFSCFAWINTISLASCCIAGRYETSGTLRAWYMDIDAGNFRVILSKDGTYTAGNRKFYYSTDTYRDGDWHQVGFTFYDDSLILYVDGYEITPTKYYDDTINTIHDPTTDFFIGARGGASPTAYFDGELDELSLWEVALSASEVEELWNGGAAMDLTLHTEYLNLGSWWRMGDYDTMPTIQDNHGINNATAINMESSDIVVSDLSSYVLDNPSVISLYGYSFTNRISSFIPSVSLPSGSAMKYQVSSDNGTTWKYYDGASWVSITPAMSDDWYYENEANTSSIVNTYVTELAVSGIFTFKGFLHSDTGAETPVLDGIYIEEGTTYKTGDFEIEMKESIIFSKCFGLLDFSDIKTIPVTSTSVKYKISTDNSTYNANWLNSTETGEFIQNIYCDNDGSDMIRFKIQLLSSSSFYTPEIDDIELFSDQGYIEYGNFTSGWYQWNEFVVFKTLTFSISEPANCECNIFVRFSEELVDPLYYFQEGIHDKTYNTVGNRFQFLIELNTDGRYTAIYDWLEFTYYIYY